MLGTAVVALNRDRRLQPRWFRAWLCPRSGDGESPCSRNGKTGVQSVFTPYQQLKKGRKGNYTLTSRLFWKGKVPSIGGSQAEEGDV